MLITVCLLVTVAAVSAQNSANFRKVLDKQLEDGTAVQAKDAANSVGALLESWRSQLALVMHGMAGGTKADVDRSLAAFVSSNREYLAASVFKGAARPAELAFAKASAEGEIRYEDKVPDAVHKAVRLAARRAVLKLAKAGDKAPQFSLENWQREAGVPVVGVVMSFVEAGSKERHWVVLATWQTRLLSALPSTALIKTRLTTEDGLTVLSADPSEVGQVSPVARRFHKVITESRSPAGVNAFTDEAGVDRVAAFALLPSVSLVAVVSRDAGSAYREITLIIAKTAAWAMVFLLGAIMVSYLAVSGVTRNLTAVTETTARIAQGDFAATLVPKTKDEIGVLSHAVNDMSQQIQSLLKSKVEMARQEKELETAKLVQETLFPRGDILTPGLLVTGHCSPASECGGDWWGHFRTEDGAHVVMIADATGHGAAAALVTAVAYSCCMTLASTYKRAASADTALKELLETLNDLLYRAGQGETTATFLAMMIDPRTGTMRAASAGHTMPYLIAAPASDAEADAKPPAPKIIRCSGTPLGFSETIEFTESSGTVKPGDKIFLYTDGLIECTDPAHKQWSKRRLEKALARCATLDPRAMKDAIVTEAFEHYAGQPLDDDITIVVLEVEAEGAALTLERAAS